MNEEFLDIEDTINLDDSIVETLDDTLVETLDLDDRISNEIDDILSDAKPSIKKDTIKKPKEDEKLNDYKPSIKDFNIKNKKVKKIVFKSMLYVIIALLLGFEFLINTADKTLKSLRVYAKDDQPIRIVQNEKYGYINSFGTKIASPKYSYGENFIKGYAIVKDYSNLPLVINRSGNVAVPTGYYFSIIRCDEDIIASKVTKKGLKYGILNSDLKIKAKFLYDMITYKKGFYTYSKGNSVGIINKEGKDIYNYKLTENVDKKIIVNVSEVNDNKNTSYAVVTVNGSSVIINTNTGKVITTPTINAIEALENNVFSEKTESGKKYFYVYDDKVLVEQDTYNLLRINSISSGVLTAIDKDMKYKYISTKTLEQLNDNLTEDSVYYGDNVFMYKSYDFEKNLDSIVLIKNGEVIKTILGYNVYKPFKNGAAILSYPDGTYTYINENGDFITNDKYEKAFEFDKLGDAICVKDSLYGVINKKGKIVLKFKYKDIKMASEEVKLANINSNKNVSFIAVENESYELFNNKGKKYNNKHYENAEFDKKYPIVKLSTQSQDYLFFPREDTMLPITSFNSEYRAFENYVIIKNMYYNYNGKAIYEGKKTDE